MISLDSLWNPKHDSAYDYKANVEVIHPYLDYLKGKTNGNDHKYYNESNFGVINSFWDSRSGLSSEVIQKYENPAPTREFAVVKKTGEHVILDAYASRSTYIDIKGRLFHKDELEMQKPMQSTFDVRKTKPYMKFDEIFCDEDLSMLARLSPKCYMEPDFSYRFGIDVRGYRTISKYHKEVRLFHNALAECSIFFDVKKEHYAGERLMIDPTGPVVPIKYEIAKCMYVTANGYLVDKAFYKGFDSGEHVVRRYYPFIFM